MTMALLTCWYDVQVGAVMGYLGDSGLREHPAQVPPHPGLH